MYKIIRHLSIDVALGAAAMMYLVSGYLDTRVDTIYYFLLALITWLIYTTDHLMDARNIKHEASTPRHRFHQKYYKPILTAAVIGLFLFVGLIPRQTSEMLFRLSLGLSGLILLYFLSLIWARKTQYRYVFKELFIAGCYTLGVSLVPVFHAWPIGRDGWQLLLLIFLLAFSNLLLFSVREAQNDLKDKNPSAIRFIGLPALNQILGFVLWIAFALSAFLLILDSLFYGVLLLSMSSSLLCLFYFPKLFRKNEAYRVIGDGIFLIPFIGALIHLIFMQG